MKRKVGEREGRGRMGGEGEMKGRIIQRPI